MSVVEQVPVLDPKEAQENGAWLFLGGRGSGKTTAMISVLRDIRNRFDVVFLIAYSKDEQNNYDCIPDTHKYSQVDSNFLSHLRSVEQVQRILVVLEDGAIQQQKNMHGEIKNLLESHHGGITLFYSSQYGYAWPPKIRNIFNYVFVGRILSQRCRKAIKKQYFSDAGDFKAFLNRTNNYDFFVFGSNSSTLVKTFHGIY